jgi:amino acid permease
MTALARTLRQSDLLLLFIGSVIGSGIFLTPGLILRQLNGSVGFWCGSLEEFFRSLAR